MTNRLVEADVLIVGGGIQGLTILHELSEAGARRVLLISADELGVGETFHSHDYMHHGYMMPSASPDLVQELRECGAWWSERIRPPRKSELDTYYAVDEEEAAERIRQWEEGGLIAEQAKEMPVALRDGDADGNGTRLFSIADRTVPMRDLVKDLAASLQKHIVRARLAAIQLDASGRSVTNCRLSVDSGAMIVRPRLLLLACGRRAQPLLRTAETPAGHRPLAPLCTKLNRIRFLPMLLVRGRDLPVVTCIFESHALWILTHPLGDGESMYIVSLLEGHETERRDFEPARERIPGGAAVAETVKRLRSLVPGLRARLANDLRFSFYFGAKIDHPEGGNRRYLNDCGLANLRLAWPGLWSLSLANARQIVEELKASPDFADAFDPARSPLKLKSAGLRAGALVGQELRLTKAQTWHTWSRFKQLQEVP